MSIQDALQSERMDMLRWVSERNMHVPLTDLAFMLGMNEELPDMEDAGMESRLYGYAAD